MLKINNLNANVENKSILKGFSFAMIIGVIIGTYSSIFVASPFLGFLKVNYKTLEKKEENISN